MFELVKVRVVKIKLKIKLSKNNNTISKDELVNLNMTSPNISLDISDLSKESHDKVTYKNNIIDTPRNKLIMNLKNNIDSFPVTAIWSSGKEQIFNNIGSIITYLETIDISNDKKIIDFLGALGLKTNDCVDASSSDEDIVYDKHYVSFAILFPFDYGFSSSSSMNYLMGTNILVKEDKQIASYKIKIEPEFKYKKFIRSKVLEDFNYKNKDIQVIKSINTYKNYHNYIVVLKNKSVRHKQYPNAINSVADTYKWKQVYDMYNPDEMTPEIKNFGAKDGYSYLSEHSLLKIKFTDNLNTNHVDLKDIYKSIVLVM